MTLYRTSIPYNTAHEISGDAIRPGTLRARWRRGQVACAVVGPKPGTAIYGRVETFVDHPDRLELVLDLGAPDARTVRDALEAGVDFYAQPLGRAGVLYAVELGGLETWPSARLHPADETPTPARVVPPIGPRPTVNLAPIPGNPARP